MKPHDASAKDRSKPRALLLAAIFCASPTIMTGCRSENGSLPPVFGAVFGLDSASSIPYQVGKVPEPAVKPGDTVVGDAANNPGQCIWRDRANRRYRAACPEGYGAGA